jgi:hypothetical protein
MYIPKWVLLLPVVAAVGLAWKEYPALVRYLNIERI